MKKGLLILFLNSLVILSSAQSYTSSIITGINEIAGSGTAVTLTASPSSSTSSAALPIGFSFNFYGNTYTNFYLNPTGTISFGSANQNWLTGYGTTNKIPSTNTPNNFIGFAFTEPFDNYPSPNIYPDYSAASINYFTTGTNPNRVLVVNFKNVGINGSFPIAKHFLNIQVQISESNGKIEIHNTTNSAVYSSSYGRYDYAQIGVENSSGTSGTAATNTSNWNMDNKTVRFTYCSISPSDPTNVTNSSTICSLTNPNTQSVNLSATCVSGSAVWYNSTSTTALASTTVTPTVNTTYKVRCENNGCNSNYANTTITVANKIADPTNVTTDQTICSAGSSINLVGSCTNSYPSWYNASNTLLSSYNSYTNSTSLYNASVSVSPSASTSYTIKCENTSYLVCSGSKTVNVAVSTLTNPSNVTASQTICAGTSINLQGTCATGTKEWGLWNGNTYGVFTNTTVSPTTSSFYKVSCVSGTCSTFQNVSITVIALPSAPTSITKNPNTEVNPNTSVSLTANGCLSGNTIKWENGSTTNPRVVTPAISTSYSAKCVNGTCESSASTSTSVVIKTITISNTTPSSSCSIGGSVIPVVFTTEGSFTGNFQVRLMQHKVIPPYVDTNNPVVTISSSISPANLYISSNLPLTGFDGSATYDYYISVVDYSGTVVSQNYVVNLVSPPVLSDITASPTLPTNIGQTSTLSATCPNGIITWKKILNDLTESNIGTGTSTVVTPSNFSHSYIAECNTTTCSIRKTYNFDISVSNSTEVYKLGFGSGVGSSCQGCGNPNYSFSPLTFDDSYSSYSQSNYFTKSTYTVGSYNTSPSLSMKSISRNNYNWEMLSKTTSFCCSGSNNMTFFNLNSTNDRTAITKFKYDTPNPPCNATWLVNEVETNYTLTGYCTVVPNISTINFPDNKCSGDQITVSIASPANMQEYKVQLVHYGYNYQPQGSSSFFQYVLTEFTSISNSTTFTIPLIYKSSGSSPSNGGTRKDYYKIRIVPTGFADDLGVSREITLKTLDDCCIQNLDLSSSNVPSDDISSGIFIKKASLNNGNITATNKITGSAKVTYQAKTIQLNAGFKADNGTVFKAEVGGCQ